MLIDRQKEIVATYRVVFTILFTSLLGLIGFVVINFNKLNEIQLILSFIGFSLIVLSLSFVTIMMVKAIDKLKDLEWVMQY